MSEYIKDIGGNASTIVSYMLIMIFYQTGSGKPDFKKEIHFRPSTPWPYPNLIDSNLLF